MRKRFFAGVIIAIAISLLMATPVFADVASENNRWYFDTVQACKHDGGYTKASNLKEKDPHYGWKMGRFVISGFTSRTQDETPIFLKNVGDQITLSFILEQNIDKLNGEEGFVVWTDENGYDEYFGIPKSNFGRGMLIIRHTDYQNDASDPTMYKDYLKSVEIGAETVVDVFEEGDYEVALDYETRSPSIIKVPEYHDYRIFFRFKVRNSNTMLFLFDTETGNELYNGSVTENGFRIDTANSHYLEIGVKKEILNDTRDGLIEDTRFNRSATNGSTFTDPGIYTVTVRNPTTGDEPTIKVIYVGDDDLLKATVANGMTVTEVQQYLDDGATVASDGTLMQASADANDLNGEEADQNQEASSDSELDNSKRSKKGLPIIRIILIVTAVIASTRILRLLRRQKRQSPKPEDDQESKTLSEDGEL